MVEGKPSTDVTDRFARSLEGCLPVEPKIALVPAPPSVHGRVF